VTDEEISEGMWAAMAQAIMGSGTYQLNGNSEQQIDALTDWMKLGRDRGFDWRSLYVQLHKRWSTKRPQMPPIDLMDEKMKKPGVGREGPRTALPRPAGLRL
jgi:hypothetical protein